MNYRVWKKKKPAFLLACLLWLTRSYFNSFDIIRSITYSELSERSIQNECGLRNSPGPFPVPSIL